VTIDGGSLREALDTWYKLVSDYTGRNLTRQSDKLPAISSLASLFADHFGLSYLAGIWQEDFRRGLLWEAPYSQNDYDVFETDGTKRKGQRAQLPSFGGVKPEIFRAPRWSWASVDGSVEFLKRRQMSTFPSELDARLLDVYRLSESSSDWEGQTSRVQIMLKALTKPVTWQYSGSEALSGPRSVQISDEHDNGIGVRALVDDMRFRNGTGRLMRIASQDTSTVSWEHAILMIPEVGDAWQRVGIALIGCWDDEREGAFGGCDFHEVLLA